VKQFPSFKDGAFDFDTRQEVKDRNPMAFLKARIWQLPILREACNSAATLQICIDRIKELLGQNMAPVLVHGDFLVWRSLEKAKQLRPIDNCLVITEQGPLHGSMNQLQIAFRSAGPFWGN